MIKKVICLVPEVQSLGGPRTFQRNLIDWSERTGLVEFTFDADRKDIDAFLLIGGPKKYLMKLIRARMKGIPVIHRLNGINWIHHRVKLGLKYSLHAEFANLAIAFYRRCVCSRIVYQSPFCKRRWNNRYGSTVKPSKIIYNGTDLDIFRPGSEAPDLSKRIDFILVEGSFKYGMNFGLGVAIGLALDLASRFPQKIVVHTAGKLDESDQQQVRERIEASGKKNVEVVFEGVLNREQLIALEQKAAFLFSAELNPACPNAVIESLACGVPVIGFDTGALKEVTGEGGVIVPYGADPWKLESPRRGPLTDAAETVIRENERYRVAARNRAKHNFSIERCAEAYVRFCLGVNDREEDE